MSNRLWRLAAALTTLALIPVVATGCGSDDDASGGAAGGGGGGKIALVAYSTPQEVYTDHLIPAFQKSEAGKGTELTTSFAGSGDSRRAIESGLPTDYVHMNLEPDMTILEEQGLIASDYRDDEYKGSPQQSVVVIATRPGNPLNIKTWDDILNKDIEIINANPFTSGGARWNVMAVYGQVIKAGGTEEEGLAAVRKLLERVPTYPASARDALNEFLGGKGDVALQYENEAIQARLRGRGHRVHRPRRDDQDRHARGHRDRGREPRGGQGLLRLPAHRRGAGDLGRERLPAGRRVDPQGA